MSRTAEFEEGRNPKQRRKIAVSLHGETFCNKCAKKVDFNDREQFAPGQLKIHYNTDFDTKSGDLLTCSGGCGKTIIGQKKYYGGEL